ncbi:adhesin transport system outer membrane protein [Novosphingobium kunmingense]|uniref:Adhesin transport system outer membrane protein n=1 Tax=Novosphingobium kunmingense TaxID=1211806 RepID=A0A2N0H763_9SPHN|nr:TolC family protein [Novosphingobium kunmingense]PKB14781.1 adhesin transport system outer membrane protein [Novosphingobium kunmingense]
MTFRKSLAAGLATLLASAATPALAQSAPVSMQDVIAVAVNSNPEIAQAQYNKEAIQFERKQAQGLYAPRVDIEGSAGIRHLDNPTRRLTGIHNNELYPVTGEARADWTIIDFGRRRGELLRQAARVDGASLRVVERSEFIGLQVARQYLDVLLQQRVVAASMDNAAFHEALVNDLGSGVEQGSISIADQQQAQERLQAARVRAIEAQQALTEAKIQLRTLSGLDVDAVVQPPTLAEAMPGSVAEAIGLARTQNPRVREAEADVDASHALASSVKAEQLPKIGVDVVGRIGHDIDGVDGATRDVQARAYLRWNIFDGGINRANYQEMVRRASESRYRLYTVVRQSEEDVRTAWSKLDSQNRITTDLEAQSRVSDDLLLSYRSQFNVGRRSLLDVLDAQNARYNTQVRLETARFSAIFARYQTLAATNRFLSAMNVAPGAGAGEKERERFNYGPPKPAELEYRTMPK